MLPTFLVIGASKAGTTSMYGYLRAHPQVFMSAKKELKFFIPKRNWSRGIDWYEEQFDQANNAVAIGEASPGYTKYPRTRGVPALIAQVLPDIRLIYLVRQPIDRMISQYLRNLRRFWESELSPEKALLDDPRYLDPSRYAMQIEQYLEYFPREQLLIVKTEDLHAATTMERVFRFLDVDVLTPANLGERYNARSSRQQRAARPSASFISRNLRRRLPGYKRLLAHTPSAFKKMKQRIVAKEMESTIEIAPEARQELLKRLRPDVARLRDYIGEDFDGWGIG
jgi:sulfotransferase family protein